MFYIMFYLATEAKAKTAPNTIQVHCFAHCNELIFKDAMIKGLLVKFSSSIPSDNFTSMLTTDVGMACMQIFSCGWGSFNFYQNIKVIEKKKTRKSKDFSRKILENHENRQQLRKETLFVLLYKK